MLPRDVVHTVLLPASKRGQSRGKESISGASALFRIPNTAVEYH